MNNTPSVAIVILNWNGLKVTDECLKSLQKVGHPNYKIVLVDNGSTDGSVAFFKEHYADIKIIANKENLGFSGGVNCGMKWALNAGCDYVLLLNNDTLIKDADFLQKMITVMQKEEETGITCPAILNENDRTTWYAGGEMDWKRGVPRVFGHERWNNHIKSTSYNVTFATGCAMLIKRSVLKAVGGFDERFFVYNEDVDYCLRAVRQGYKIKYIPDSVVYHKVNASSGGKRDVGIFHPKNENLFFFIKHRVRNRIINVMAHATAIDKIKFGCFFGAVSVKKNLNFIFRRNFKAVAAYFSSVKSGVSEGTRKKKNRKSYHL